MMKKKIVLGIVTLIIIIIILFIYYLDWIGYIGYVNYDGSEKVYLRIETNKDIFNLGEEIEIKIYLVNEDSENYRFEFDMAGYDIVSVTSENGTLVYNSIIAPAPNIRYLKVESSSEKRISKFNWDQRTRLAAGDAILPGSDIPIEAGNYSIYAELIGYKEIKGSKVFSIE